jgi:hypothetical protein
MVSEIFKFYSIVLLARWFVSADRIVMWLAAVYLVIGAIMKQNSDKAFVLNYLLLIKSIVYFGDEMFAEKFDSLDVFVQFDIALHIAMVSVVTCVFALKLMCRRKTKPEFDEIIVDSDDEIITDEDNIWSRRRSRRASI